LSYQKKQSVRKVGSQGRKNPARAVGFTSERGKERGWLHSLSPKLEKKGESKRGIDVKLVPYHSEKGGGKTRKGKTPAFYHLEQGKKKRTRVDVWGKGRGGGYGVEPPR